MPIHPAVIKEFEKKGYVFKDPTAEGFQKGDDACFIKGLSKGKTNHTTFYQTLAMLRETGSLKQKIIAAKRVKIGDKEWVVLALDIVGAHYSGEPVAEHWPDYGFYEMPVWKRVFSGVRNRWEETDEVVSSQPVYEIPFKGDKTDFKDIDGKTVKLVDMIDGETRFLVQSRHKLKVSQSDWFRLGYDEIVKKYEESATQTALQDLTDAIKKAELLTGGKQ